ncbi:unnamed protein product [Schistocephalus solidus]|uniref:BHLH domain-containing protein n=1 Tax=Schistocephalus solidus TaxID=70667 RepID=A0A183S9H4_SCHSO|nr:unnamed protein product [Schistocephalus solidus]
MRANGDRDPQAPMSNLNQAFARLRALVPSHPPERRMSKQEILRQAINYIRVLETLLWEMEQEATATGVVVVRGPSRTMAP